MPPFVGFGDFLSQFDWEQGQHVTMVGTTGSGKTTLAMQLLPRRTYTIVLATKNKDRVLYPDLECQGFVMTAKADEINWEETPKVIFRPKLEVKRGEPVKLARSEQGVAFEECLADVFTEGGWCLYADEIRYITDNPKLKEWMEVLWLQGRSNDISIMVATQRPVSIPLLAFDQASHLFFWKNTDMVNIKRMSEMSGADQEMVRYVIPRLPEHEFLYINTRTGEMLRSKERI
jgi:hypothetical protein